MKRIQILSRKCWLQAGLSFPVIPLSFPFKDMHMRKRTSAMQRKNTNGSRCKRTKGNFNQCDAKSMKCNAKVQVYSDAMQCAISMQSNAKVRFQCNYDAMQNALSMLFRNNAMQKRTFNAISLQYNAQVNI